MADTPTPKPAASPSNPDAPLTRADAPIAKVEESPAARSWRRRLFHIFSQVLIIAILLVVVFGIYIYFGRTDHGPTVTEAAGPIAPIPVGILVVEPRDVPLESRFLAQTEASQLVPIRARVSGYLLERNFEEGQRVEQDQVLFRLDPEPFEVARAQAAAQMAASQARLQRAEQQLERTQSLVERRAASVDELEQWEEEQQVAMADVRLQEARIAQAELELSYTTIRSPITGMIGESQQDVGSYISPTGDALLATVQQVDPIYVRYSVSEQEILRWERMVKEGAIADVATEQIQVEILLADGRAYPHVGQINYVDVAVDPSTGTAVVRASVPNPEAVLRPGQFVTAVVTGTHRIDAILVPQGAVMQNPTGASVYVVDEAGKTQLRSVQAGEWHGSEWIIESGLEAGDRLIIDHLMQIRPGAAVEPIPQEPIPQEPKTQEPETQEPETQEPETQEPKTQEVVTQRE